MTNKKIIIRICLCFAVLIIFIVNMFVQMNIVGSYPLDETVRKAVVSLIFRGELLHVILVTGIALYFLMSIHQHTKKNNQLEGMIAKLHRKDFSPIEQLNDDAHIAELQKNINALTEWINRLKENDLSAKQHEKLFCAKTEEQDKELEKMRGIIRDLTQNISSLEEKHSAALEELTITRNTVTSYNEKITEQFVVTKDADNSISESLALINNLSRKMNESAAFSAGLEKDIIDGEDEVLEVSDMIKSISVDLEKIQEITRTINKISEQTNILSMNAAIESAHAGVAGKGFAVVAEEIRKLADSTKENAEQINREINALIEKIKEALKTSNASSVSFKGITEKIRGFSHEIISIDSIASQSLEKTERIREAVRKSAEISQLAQKGTSEIHTEQKDFSHDSKIIEHQTMTSSDNLLRENSTDANQQLRRRARETAEYVGSYRNGLNEGLVPRSNDIDVGEHIPHSPSITPQNSGVSNPHGNQSFSFYSSISAEARELNKKEETKTHIYTLKKPSESEKKEDAKNRELIKTVEFPEKQTLSKSANFDNTDEESLSDYDERGVAVKRPPTTIF
jgi:methyl-accepting chemotaxis protein